MEDDQHTGLHTGLSGDVDRLAVSMDSAVPEGNEEMNVVAIPEAGETSTVEGMLHGFVLEMPAAVRSYSFFHILPTECYCRYRLSSLQPSDQSYASLPQAYADGKRQNELQLGTIVDLE